MKLQDDCKRDLKSKQTFVNGARLVDRRYQINKLLFQKSFRVHLELTFEFETEVDLGELTNLRDI